MEQKVYQIPRKVDAGLRFFGLNLIGLVIMLIPAGLSILAWLTPMSIKAKLCISVLLVYGTYLLLTVDLNGQTGFQFIWLLIKHMNSQKVFSLTSSKDFVEPDSDEKHLIRLYRANKQTGVDRNAGSTH